MKKLPYILIALIIIAAAGGFGYWSYKFYPVRNEISNGANSTSQPNTTKDANQALSYTHPDLNFSFKYPGNYKLANLADDQGETILLQDNGKGAQIYISEFTADADFNSALVRQSLSNEKLENLKDIQMPNGFNAVSFSGKDASLGEVWDVWFAHSGKLYQITGQPGHDRLLKSLVESFKFDQ